MNTAVADPVAAPIPASAEAVSAPAPVAATIPAPEPTALKAGTRLLVEDSKPSEVIATDAAKTETKVDAPVTEWALKAPEGATITETDLKGVESFAKANGLTQAQAEKILARDMSFRTAAEQAQKAEVDAVGDTWLKQAQEHPEIGGKNLDAAVANAKRVLQAIATPEERKAIAESPFANNPMFLAMMNRAAKLLPQEDTVHASAGSQQAPLNAAQILYPNKYR